MVPVSLDHGPLFRFKQWQANLRILEVEAIQTRTSAPVSHPFIERLISRLRRVFGPGVVLVLSDAGSNPFHR